jgi:hypothetical protein
MMPTRLHLPREELLQVIHKPKLLAPYLDIPQVLGYTKAGRPIYEVMGGVQRGVYTVSFQAITANNADGNHDWFEIDPAADKPVEICGLFIGNSSDFADAQAENLRYSIVYMSGGTFTSGGEVSTTARPIDPADGAASGAYEAFNSNGTAASTSGTSVIRHADSFNVATGLQVIWPPEFRHKVDGAANSAMLVRNDSTVADDIVFDGVMYVREL